MIQREIYHNFCSSCLWVMYIGLMSNLFTVLFTVFPVPCNKYVACYEPKKKSSPKK